VQNSIHGMTKKYPAIFFTTVSNGKGWGTERSGRRDFHEHA
jgi:hypothetical protein